MKTCTVPDCGNKYLANGFCSKHYHRARQGYIYTEREIFIRDNPPKDGIGLIPLTKGKVAIVDAFDYDLVLSRVWHLDDSKPNLQYAANNKNKEERVKMHRFIMNVGEVGVVDHINGNGLDNRRCNLRACTFSENARNSRKKNKNAASKFKGVSMDKTRWKACIRFDNKTKHLAMCDTEEEAAIYYDVAAQLFYGEFANLNFPLNKCSVS
jgi:HNH endonuclease